MASPFSRTMRSLYADHFYVSLAGLVIAVVLAFIWGHWFFTAKVTFYETSRKVYVTNEETVIAGFPEGGRGSTQRAQTIRRRRVVAEFPLETGEDLHPGQTAFLYLDSTPERSTGAIPALVTSIIATRGKETIQVELYAEVGGDLPNPFKEGAGGEVKIEARHMTPAMLVMQASGLFTETPRTSLSPQRLSNFERGSGE